MDSLTVIKLIGISIPLVELIQTEELSTGAIAISVAFLTPYAFISCLKASQSNSGLKSVRSFTPLALRSQGNVPLPYHVLSESKHLPRSLASSIVVSVK